MMGAAMNMGMTTPPLSAGTSFDSKHDSAIGGDDTPVAGGRGRLVFDEEYFKANVNRVVTDEWNEVVMECEVTGMPTKDHWKVSISFFSFLCCFVLFPRWISWTGGCRMRFAELLRQLDMKQAQLSTWIRYHRLDLGSVSASHLDCTTRE